MQPIGVMGGKWNLPLEFPSEVLGNSGDLIHTMAPLSILPNAVHNKDPRLRLSGASSFRPFVNEYASHLVVVLANVLRNDHPDGSNYANFQRALEQYTKPIVVFGLGVQAASTEIEDIALPREAVELMQFLSSRSEAVGVRGPFTKQVLEDYCGVRNAYVTGCPSLYARPDAIRQLLEVHEGKKNVEGRFSFNVTDLERDTEKMVLAKGIQADGYLIEPVSRRGHSYHRALQSGLQADPPYYFKRMLRDEKYGLTAQQVEHFYRERYRYFRTPDPWLDFNHEYVSWSYGTRFHVNMATVLSGKPALWLTHDSRTEELAEFMHLPSADLTDVHDMEPSELYELMDYSDFFEHIPGLFQNFSDYLEINGLQGIESPV